MSKGNLATLTPEQKDRIREVVKEILLSRVETFPEETTLIRNAPFHERILNAFSHKLGSLKVPIPYLVAIASWMHGLNTSLGSGFESLAHILSGGYKKKFTKSFCPQIVDAQAAMIDQILRDLKAGTRNPNVDSENQLIFDISDNGQLIKCLEFTVDNFLDKGDAIEAVELKSVRPNSGEGRGEKQKILYAKAALKRLYPDKEIKYFIGFPFDPTSNEPTKYDKARFFNYLIEFKKFFAPDEVLIADELWTKLSGVKNTMQQILDEISAVVSIFQKNSS